MGGAGSGVAADDANSTSEPTERDLAIVIVAAGSARRMGFDKLWADLGGQPLVARSLASAATVRPRELVLVVAAERIDEAKQLAPRARVVAGGPRRRDSVQAGMRATSARWIAVHDAARALGSPALYARGYAAAQRSGCAIPVVPLKDTVKRVDDGIVNGTIDRARHAAVQTPQVFRRDLLERALALTDDDVTDEATLVERLGVPVATFPGEEDNFKVTTPLDFEMAWWLVQRTTEVAR